MLLKVLLKASEDGSEGEIGALAGIQSCLRRGLQGRKASLIRAVDQEAADGCSAAWQAYFRAQASI